MATFEDITVAKKNGVLKIHINRKPLLNLPNFQLTYALIHV